MRARVRAGKRQPATSGGRTRGRGKERRARAAEGKAGGAAAEVQQREREGPQWLAKARADAGQRTCARIR